MTVGLPDVVWVDTVPLSRDGVKDKVSSSVREGERLREALRLGEAETVVAETEALCVQLSVKATEALWLVEAEALREVLGLEVHMWDKETVWVVERTADAERVPVGVPETDAETDRVGRAVPVSETVSVALAVLE